jgi:hypothetical protein
MTLIFFLNSFLTATTAAMTKMLSISMLRKCTSCTEMPDELHRTALLKDVKLYR